MEKLDLHESIRIYVPGLFICLLGGYFVYGPKLDFSKIAVLAIFIGLMYAPVIHHLHDSYFKKIVAAYERGIGFNAAWKQDMITYKSGPIYGTLSEKVNLIPVDRIGIYTKAFYASRYNSAELYGFRLQKTFGIMYFNIAIASLFAVGCIVVEYLVDIFPSYVPVFMRARYDMIALLAISSISLWAAKNYFKRSLDNELLYWRGLSATDMQKFGELLLDRQTSS